MHSIHKVNISENKFRTTDGIDLRYRTWFPHQPRSAVLLVHGAGEHIERYEHLGFRLSEKGHAFVAFDLRGFGHSGGQSGHVTRFYDYLNDVDQLVTFFKQRVKQIPFYLAGHSLGGLIVTRFAQYRPRRVDGIILSAPAIGFNVQIPPVITWIVQFISSIAPSFSVNPFHLIKRAQTIPYLKSFIPSQVKSYLGGYDPKNSLVCSRYSARWLQELLTHAVKAVQQAKDVIVPVLCLHGENDPLIPLDHVQTFFNGLIVKEKQWVVVPQAKHVLFHPENFQSIDSVLNWLNRDVHRLPKYRNTSSYSKANTSSNN